MTFDELFKKCDIDGNNLLHKAEFADIIKESNESLSKIKWLIIREFGNADINNDDSLTYEEAFLNFEKHFKNMYHNILTKDHVFKMKDAPSCESCSGLFWQDGPNLQMCCLLFICRNCYLKYCIEHLCPACKCERDISKYITVGEVQ